MSSDLKLSESNSTKLFTEFSVQASASAGRHIIAKKNKRRAKRNEKKSIKCIYICIRKQQVLTVDLLDHGSEI